MSAYRCWCGTRKPKGQAQCLVHQSASYRQRAGSAPEFNRAPAPLGPTTETGRGTKRAAVPSRDREVTSRAGAHPSFPREDISYPCFAHDYPSALNCVQCIENGERDWEAVVI